MRFNMPKSPKIKKRPWIDERVKHSRAVDMSAFYNSSKWRKFSKQFKIDNPICVECERNGLIVKSTRTDHIVRLRDGGGSDLNNLNPKDFQALCTKCHASKSGREAHGYKQGDRGNIAKIK